MPANRFFDPFPQKFSATTGNVGAGWKLYFYQGGSTTTLQDTYSDVTLTTVNANPVVADSAGLFGDIFLDSALSYACKLTDENDVQIDYADYIQQTTNTQIAQMQREVLAGSDAVGQVFTLTSFTYTTGDTQNLLVFQNGNLLEPGPSNDYEETSSSSITVNSSITINPADKWTFLKNVVSATVENAANVQYDPAGIGAVSTNVQAKLREWVSVTDFGADSTGTADCASSLESAIAACFPSSATYSAGGVDYYVATKALYFPPGVYKVSSTVSNTLTPSATKIFVGLSIYGDSARPVYAGAAAGLNPAAATIIADSGASWAANQSVIDLQYHNYCSIENIAVRGISGTTKAVDISNGAGWKTDSVSIYQSKYGLYSNASGLAIHKRIGISNCTDIAMYMKDSGDSDIESPYINTNNQDYATDLNKGIGIYMATSKNCNIRGGKIEYNSIGIYVLDNQGLNITGVNFDVNGQSHILLNYTSASGTTPNSLQIKSITITGNRFLAGGQLGGTIPGAHIHCYSATADSHVVITGNSFRKGAGGAYDDNPFIGAQAVGPLTYCIYSDHQGTSSYYNTFAVSGNDFYNGSKANTIGVSAPSGANVSYVGDNIINLPNFISGTNVSVFSKPSFRAVSNTTTNNQTGDGTAYTVIFGIEEYDTENDYNNTTGQFTAPSDGVYLFNASIGVKDHATSAWTSVVAGIKTTAVASGNNALESSVVAGDVQLTGSVIVKMTAGQTAEVEVAASGGSLAADIGPYINQMYFSGYKLS